MKKNRTKQGIIIKPQQGLNYGQTVDILDEAKYPESWIIQPHETKQILSVPKTDIYFSNRIKY